MMTWSFSAFAGLGDNIAKSFEQYLAEHNLEEVISKIDASAYSSLIRQLELDSNNNSQLLDSAAQIIKKYRVHHLDAHDFFNQFHQSLKNYLPNHCLVCGKTASKYCSACKKAYYCSKICQKNHWDVQHKSQCSGHKGKRKNRKPSPERKSEPKNKLTQVREVRYHFLNATTSEITFKIQGIGEPMTLAHERSSITVAIYPSQSTMAQNGLKLEMFEVSHEQVSPSMLSAMHENFQDISRFEAQTENPDGIIDIRIAIRPIFSPSDLCCFVGYTPKLPKVTMNKQGQLLK